MKPDITANGIGSREFVVLNELTEFISKTLLSDPTEIISLVPQSPQDGITSVTFSPQADFFAVTSWDNHVRIYEANSQTGSAVGKALYLHEKPVFCSTWSGADNAGRMFDVTTQSTVQVAQHDQPIKSIKYLDNNNVVLTGGWDKMLKYWDLRTSQCVMNVSLPERVFAMDSLHPYLVVGVYDKRVFLYNLNNPQQHVKETTSTLKWQTRCLTCFPAGNGYAVGSIEGRVGIQYFDEKENQEGNNVYSVNAISFHPVYGTFSTAGSDGTFIFWDKDSKSRLKGFASVGTPITASDFNRTGTIFAYAVSYDWSKGYLQYPQLPSKNAIYLHAVKEEDVKPKQSKKR
ncbi:4176_t:CDS:2 [Entrophospora sp. SA101]|nr:9858_t:CDS:2 [Entrophospora sp. SA101]CAJ0637957.1 4176_t:CDS:2 [Entrophospora sp. SA101]CAJ0839265.1 16911_t:CDS:2 [Entrophospora sp. SA101]CAJ0897557.1 4311_t:CDS:2 [Entrophospora sp. SA101]